MLVSLALVIFASGYVFTYVGIVTTKSPQARIGWDMQANTYCSKSYSVPIVNDASMGFGLLRNQCIQLCENDKDCRAYTYGTWQKGIGIFGGYKGQVRCQLYSHCAQKSFQGMTLYVKRREELPKPTGAFRRSSSGPFSQLLGPDAESEEVGPRLLVAFLVPVAANLLAIVWNMRTLPSAIMCLCAASTAASSKSKAMESSWEDELTNLAPALLDAWAHGTLPSPAEVAWLVILVHLLNVLVIIAHGHGDSSSRPPSGSRPLIKSGVSYTEKDGLPDHWCGSGVVHEQGDWRLQPPDARTVAALASMLHVPDPSQLGKGRDAKAYNRTYKSLELYTAWRVEYPDKYFEYSTRRAAVANKVKTLVECGLSLVRAGVTLPGVMSMPGQLREDANEVYLLSGTKPEYLLAILNQGLNSKLSALEGAFGAGIYLAEDAAKIDQYTAPDSSYDQKGLEELHARLFPDSWLPHPGEDLFYCLVVRTTMGWGLRTMDGSTDLDNEGAPLYHNDENRELAIIPGSRPPLRYFSLVVEKGKALKRFREFVIFNDSQCYVEYIIAYKRK